MLQKLLWKLLSLMAQQVLLQKLPGKLLAVMTHQVLIQVLAQLKPDDASYSQH